ncbi:MAG: potassium transporter Kup [Acetobacteraceae bacterium]|nr:potassium transporter Kup [Acetobacteraceae bacterium]
MAETVTAQQAPSEHRGLRGGLLLGALGVVFGDIGTSPIYTLRESFKAAGAATDATTALGVLSLVVWTIMAIVTFKYVLLVMRADNDGEGGIVALLSTVLPSIQDDRVRYAFTAFAIFGAALFYGDGMITPAISVLSAVEGLQVSTPVFQPYVVPITVAILVLLFLVQSRGSERIGAYFGPVMLAWFAVIAAAGLVHVAQRPGVLAAADPLHAVRFCLAAPGRSFVTLGSVFLAVTGAEALYADMGHFGRGAIRVDWLCFVLPALLLNYAGQAALVLDDPGALDNPFFHLVPGWAVLPLVLLATAATVIASQAVISGAFSLTQQAVQLGLLPRLNVRQTSATTAGQVYVPQVNWLLMVGVVALVLAFRSSDALASAYGIAVTGTMVTTAVLLIIAMRNLWHWPLPIALVVGGAFLLLDCVFFAANALKIPEGGWVPLLIGVTVFALMETWRAGRKLVLDKQSDDTVPLETLARRVAAGEVQRTPGTGVYLTARSGMVPSALAEILKHVGVLHENVVMLTVKTERVPQVEPAERASREELAPGFARVTLRFGFAEQPDVPAALREHAATARVPDEANYFTGRELPVPKLQPDMARWREVIFIFLTRNAVSAADYFAIPSEQVVEVGARVEI